MTSRKLKPTPGPWYYNSLDEWDHSVVTSHGETDDGSTRLWTVASANINRDEKEDNARLIAEAGTVHHECGLSPRELLAAVRDLQTAISDYLERQDDLDNRKYHGINAEPHDTLMRRRNYARDGLDSALAKHKEV